MNEESADARDRSPSDRAPKDRTLNDQTPGDKAASKFSRDVGAKVKRMLKARRASSRGVWFGLGMMGLVGWSVVVPTLLGAMIGSWLDKRFPGNRSWTLVLLVMGLCLGCFNAWQWVAKQDQEMQDEQEDHHE